MVLAAATVVDATLRTLLVDGCGLAFAGEAIAAGLPLSRSAREFVTALVNAVF